jgi:aldose 1-epimerase
VKAEAGAESRPAQPRVTSEAFGTTPDGRRVMAYTMINATGMEVRLIEYGGIVLSMLVPDRDGTLDDVTLGHLALDEYLRETRYIGALIGRYANRIARGRFALGGHEYRLATNDGPNHLHGGRLGFDKVLWEVRPFEERGRVGADLAYLSRDGEEGYPGNLAVRVRCALTDDNALSFEFQATTDRATHVSLTQHSYFNLAGARRAADALDHELTLRASRFTPVDAALIPTGELRPVAGTPFDFTAPRTIGSRIGSDDEQLRQAGGYDHNFVLDGVAGAPDAPAARLVDRGSGRTLEIFTTEPGMQLYSGNMLDGAGDGDRMRPRRGVVLEAQHFPDSPNRPEFPSTLLRPGEEYRSRTVYRFGVARP